MKTNPFAKPRASLASVTLLLLCFSIPSLRAEVFGLFTYQVVGGATVEITGYPNNAAGPVNIPAEIGGKPVTSIGAEAFSLCTGLTSVTIPNSVNSIGHWAFVGCTGLTSIVIPNGVISIGSSAFYGCTGLTSVTIPNSVTSIGGGVFNGCTGLTRIAVDPLNSSYVGLEGVLFDKNLTILLRYPGGKAGSYTIPNSVTSIGQDAFSGCTGLTSVTIPDSVTSIGGGAFSGCTGLTSVTIPDSVTTIGDLAFAVCKGLTSVTIPSSVTSIGSGAFYACTGLTSVTIPSSVTNIGGSIILFGGEYPGAFAGCTGLTSVTLQQGLTIIGAGMFDGCTSLTSVTIPSSVTSIGSGAFHGCTGLTSVMIPNSVTSIGRYAFAYCTGLTSVTMPSSVTTIEGAAFFGCTGLTGLYFQGRSPALDSPDSTFEGAEQATVYYLPGTTGWGTTFGRRPTALWALPNPVILNHGPSFGVQTNGFGFIISWATNLSVVVEACTDLANPIWTPVGTNTLTGGSSYFSDPKWTNYSTRLYRLRTP